MNTRALARALSRKQCCSSSRFSRSSNSSGFSSSSSISSNSSFSSSSSSRRYFSRTLDRDIEEINQELETLFGVPNSAAGSPSEARARQQAAASSERGSSGSLTHVDEAGKASMVDISSKAETSRVATASGRVELGPEVFRLVAANRIAKGDVLTVSKIAGIQAAKQTSTLIPLCHNILLTSVNLDTELDEATSSLLVRAQASSTGPTGVEMEAMTAVAVACLTAYDMCKAASKSLRICDVQLESKSGGKSGDWQRNAAESLHQFKGH